MGDGIRNAEPNFTVFARSLTTQFASDALWQIYRRELSVVRIGLRPSNLYKSLESAGKAYGFTAYIVRARYLPPAAFNKAVASTAHLDATREEKASLLAMKRLGFEHESEVRVIVFPDESRSTPFFGCHLPDLEVSSVLVDPYLDHWQFAPLARTLEDWSGPVVRHSNFAGKAPRKLAVKKSTGKAKR